MGARQAVRERLAVLLRWRHWSSLVLAGGILLAVVELVRSTFERTTPLSVGAFAVIAIGTLLKARDLAKDFRFLRLLRPEYRGLDDFARRINASPLFLSAFITREPGTASIDAPSLIGEIGELIARIDFVGSDLARNAIAAQINADAFSGSVYQASRDVKLARNRPLAARQPASFALIRTAADTFAHAGLSTVLPMNAAGLSAYLAGKLSDNDIAPRHLARFGETPEALLVFMIASAHPIGARAAEPRGVFELLTQLALLQVVILAAQNDPAREIQVVVANAAPRWRDVFLRMNFVECPEYGSADQQTVFEIRLTIQGAPAALDLVLNAAGRFAAQLIPAPVMLPVIAGPDD